MKFIIFTRFLFLSTIVLLNFSQFVPVLCSSESEESDEISLEQREFLDSLEAQRVSEEIKSRQKLEKLITDKILGPSYEKNIRGTGGDTYRGETRVKVNMLVNKISRIDDMQMEVDVELTLRQEWYDSRLAYADQDPENLIEYITVDDFKRIWIPDIFFMNEMSGKFHSIIKPNQFLRIFPDGQVRISIRISMTLDCPMNLALFPMDNQTCSIIMESYSWTTKDVDLHWRAMNPVQLPIDNETDISEMPLPRFKLNAVTTTRCDRTTDTGNYGCIKVEFHLLRKFSFYVTHAYVPCVLLVIVSWIQFWVDENAVPARTALGVTTLLTMATQQANIQKNLPPVSYTKAIDVWSDTCVMFIFAALIEFALVNYAVRFDKRKQSRAMSMSHDYEAQTSGWLHKRWPRRSKKIDVIARILFPVSFVIFNVIYWGYYLSISNF